MFHFIGAWNPIVPLLAEPLAIGPQIPIQPTDFDHHRQPTNPNFIPNPDVNVAYFSKTQPNAPKSNTVVLPVMSKITSPHIVTTTPIWITVPSYMACAALGVVAGYLYNHYYPKDTNVLDDSEFLQHWDMEKNSTAPAVNGINNKKQSKRKVTHRKTSTSSESGRLWAYL